MIKKSFLIPLLLILSANSYAEETRYNPFTNKPDFKNNKAFSLTEMLVSMIIAAVKLNALLFLKFFIWP